MSVNLSIKSVPEALAERLRARAERNHRSLQGELMAIIEQAAYAPVPAEMADTQARRLAFSSRGTRNIEQLAAERLARPLSPQAGLPRSADIIREARDRRGTRS